MKFFYRRLKTKQHLVSVKFSSPGFSFDLYFISQITYAVFYIQNRKMCLSKKILYQYFNDFCPAWENSSCEQILCHVFKCHV